MPDRAAVVQFCATSDKAENIRVAEIQVRAAAAEGADLVVLPEMFACYGDFDAIRDASESLDGPTLKHFGQLATELSVTIIAGSIAEKVSGSDKVYNTSVVIGPNSKRLGVYRKIHLFDVDLADGPTVQESDHYLAGETPLVIDVDDMKVGITICYDLRFPELFRALSAKGAQVICIPSAFTHKTGEAHWKVLLQARAIENQCYVVAANQTGKPSNSAHSYGHSMIIDPWGKVLTELDTQTGYGMADISIQRITDVRETMPALRHRRL